MPLTIASQAEELILSASESASCGDGIPAEVASKIYRAVLESTSSEESGTPGDTLLPLLINAAEGVRMARCGDRADLCSIVSARTGGCDQDCAFCAQAKGSSADIEAHGMMDAQRILEAALQAETDGAHRFCIVTSGGKPDESSIRTVCEAVELISERTGLMRCASLGSLDAPTATRLAEHGLDRYHHNLETSRSHYPSICSTQSYDSKISTIRSVQGAGMQCCVGGILGLGESTEQRMEFAAELQSLSPDSVPVNFLDARAGTRLAGTQGVTAIEAIAFLATLRLMMPDPVIRLAGGRCETLGGLQVEALRAGVNGLLIGDLLTTGGNRSSDDIATLGALGFETGRVA